MGSGFHEPVLFSEALDALQIVVDGCYLDATFGRGGHSAGILERLGPEGRLLAFDKDPVAAQVAAERFGRDARFQFHKGSYALMESVVDSRLQVDGVLMDLGVSSPQLDTPERGFSFRADGPLDMRMDYGSGQTAAEWLMKATEQDIADVLWRYGEERYSRRIARAIVRHRAEAPLTTTSELAKLVRRAVPRREPGKDSATRSFQAIRIKINQELEELEQGLDAALSLLSVGGRLVVISFHSLEDRMVKRFMRLQSQPKAIPRRLPVADDLSGVKLKLLGKPIRPSGSELERNPRARSSMMRVAEKIA